MRDPHNLFRPEALAAQTDQQFGSIRLATPISHRMWALAALALTLCILLWLFLGTYTRREHVSGSLVPRAGLLSLTARSSGTVTQLFVSEGASVSAGTPLLTISNERSSVAYGDTAANISNEIQVEQSRLRSDLVNTQEMADQQARALHAQQTTLRNQIVQVDTQIEIEKRLERSYQATLTKYQSLTAKGYISPLDIQQQQTQMLNTQGQIAELTRQRYELGQQIRTAGDQLEQLPLATHEKISDLTQKLAQSQQSLDQNEADRAIMLRAPLAGVVSSLLVKPGQAVDANQSLLAVVPHRTPLIAELFVPSSAIGFIHVGATVMLHYQAFPYQKFGAHKGVVESISRSALTPGQVTTLQGLSSSQESVYRVRVALQTQTITAYGNSEALKPGMALDAEIMLDRRRIIEWLLEPLLGMSRRSADLRE